MPRTTHLLLTWSRHHCGGKRQHQPLSVHKGLNLQDGVFCNNVRNNRSSWSDDICR